MTFTIADTDAGATGVVGNVYIRQQGDEPGTFIGRPYDVQFEYLNSLQYGADYVSGTAQSSSYTYTFVIPQYASGPVVKWAVSEVDVQNFTGATFTASGSALAQFDRTNTVRATETVDSTPPTYQMLNLPTNEGNPRPYAYANGREKVYGLNVQDQQSGFWKGSISLAGPGGAVITTDFAYTQEPWQQEFDCGRSGGNDDRDVQCAVPVTFPSGTAEGTWTVSRLTLTDNADNTRVFKDVAPLPVVVTSDATLSASGFLASPSEVNNWTQSQNSELTFTVAGARQGISTVYVDSSTAVPWCTPLATTPTQNPDGTISIAITIRLYVDTASCPITGIAILDGAGNLALYGTQYGAPDVGVSINQIPDTTPPTVTSATLSQTTITDDQIVNGPQIMVIAHVVAPVAPVDSFGTHVYDSSGNEIGTEGGGTSMQADGTVDLPVYLPRGLAPGTYTVGFTITDAGFLYGDYTLPYGSPVPGGPLTLTVTTS